MNIYQQSQVIARTLLIGAWWSDKFKRNQLMSGTQAAARNMKKQGCPLDLALLVLARVI